MKILRNVGAHFENSTARNNFSREEKIFKVIRNFWKIVDTSVEFLVNSDEIKRNDCGDFYENVTNIIKEFWKKIWQILKKFRRFGSKIEDHIELKKKIH